MEKYSERCKLRGSTGEVLGIIIVAVRARREKEKNDFFLFTQSVSFEKYKPRDILNSFILIREKY